MYTVRKSTIVIIVLLMSGAVALFTVGVAAQQAIPIANVDGTRAASDMPMVSDYSNVTALGIVAVVLIFIVCRMLPDLHKKVIDQTGMFTDSIKELSEDFSTAITVQSEKFAATIGDTHLDIRENTRAVQDLRTHCAARFASKGE